VTSDMLPLRQTERQTDRQRESINVVTYRGRSNFDVEIVLLVREFENEWPRKLVDTNVITIH